MGINIERISPEFRTGVKDILPNFICSICDDLFEDAITLKPCDHIFCRPCLTGWITSKVVQAKK